MLVEGMIAQRFATELWTLPRGATLIRERFGVRYSPGHMWHLLRRPEFSWQKAAWRVIRRDKAPIQRWKAKR